MDYLLLKHYLTRLLELSMIYWSCSKRLSLILKQKCYCLIEWLHLLYSSEVWGIYDYKEIDEIQLKLIQSY